MVNSVWLRAGDGEIRALSNSRKQLRNNPKPGNPVHFVNKMLYSLRQGHSRQ